MPIELKKKQTEIVTLKKGSIKSNMRHEVKKEERRNKAGQNRKKGWRTNVNRKEERKLDKEASAEIEEIEQDLKMQNRISVSRKEFAMLN